MCIQIKDSIVIEGVKYSLYMYPLDSYWNIKNPKPQIRLTKTSCWRGYVATWEIIDKSLYLIDLIFYAPSGDLNFNYLFPKNVERVKADWFFGELRIPVGKVIYSEILEDDIYESDWFISVDKGIVKDQYYKLNY